MSAIRQADFRPLYNPGTGETYEFVEVGRPEERLRMRWSLQHGGRVPEHIHPRAQERFEIESGVVRFWLDGHELIRGPGERLAIPAGVPHRFAHAGSPGQVCGFVELEPGLLMRRFFEAVSGLSREGRSTRHGVPRNPLQLAVFADHFRDDFQTTQPPRALQRLILPPAAALARRLGYEEHYPRYNADRQVCDVVFEAHVSRLTGRPRRRIR